MPTNSIVTKPRFSIMAPPGAFGNHIRWLLLLDSKFNLPEFYIPSSVDEKVAYYQQLVYPTQRTWHNWLQYEWRYRRWLDPTIYLDHANELGPDYLTQQIPTLICNVDLALGLRCYLKWNSSNNGTGIGSLVGEFKNRWSLSNFEKMVADAGAQSWTKIVNVDSMFSQTLDKSLYESIIKFFDLEDHYEAAQHIHSLWYARQIDSEREMINDLNKIFNMEYDYNECS